mgnify:CR=1 FL=1
MGVSVTRSTGCQHCIGWKDRQNEYHVELRDALASSQLMTCTVYKRSDSESSDADLSAH